MSEISLAQSFESYFYTAAADPDNDLCASLQGKHFSFNQFMEELAPLVFEHIQQLKFASYPKELALLYMETVWDNEMEHEFFDPECNEGQVYENEKQWASVVMDDFKHFLRTLTHSSEQITL